MGVNIYISECNYNCLPVWARGEKYPNIEVVCFILFISFNKVETIGAKNWNIKKVFTEPSDHCVSVCFYGTS